MCHTIIKLTQQVAGCQAKFSSFPLWMDSNHQVPFKNHMTFKSQETRLSKSYSKNERGQKSRSVVCASCNGAAEVGIQGLLLYSSLVKPAGKQYSLFFSCRMSFVQGTSLLNCDKSALWILMKLGQFTLPLGSSLGLPFNFMLQHHRAANKPKSFALHFIHHK